MWAGSGTESKDWWRLSHVNNANFFILNSTTLRFKIGEMNLPMNFFLVIINRCDSIHVCVFIRFWCRSLKETGQSVFQELL